MKNVRDGILAIGLILGPILLVGIPGLAIIFLGGEIDDAEATIGVVLVIGFFVALIGSLIVWAWDRRR